MQSYGRDFFTDLPETLIPDQERAKANFDRDFEKAKKFSDFLGMVTRLAFCFLVTAYMFEKIRLGENTFFTSSAFGIFAALSFIQQMNIFNLLFSYFAHDSSVHLIKTHRWLALAVTVWTVLVFWQAIWTVSREIVVRAVGQ